MADFKFVTFNIRCVWDKDGVNSFIHRAGLILDKIDKEQPDIIAFQEVRANIREFLHKHLPEYEIAGHSQNHGENAVVVYRKDKFSLLDYEVFWLSDTPDIPDSRFENQSKYPRICSCVTLKSSQTDMPIRIYNTHLDHEVDEAKEKGIQLVLKRADADCAQNNGHTFIAGDFNALPDSDTIKLCNSFELLPLTDITSTVEKSFHNFGRNEKNTKIDYIFTDKDTAANLKDVYIWGDCVNGIYLSDHYPICTKFDL